LPRTPSGETLLEVGQLGPDALWKLKAYVSPFSPSEEQRRGEIELKRKATPELFEDLRQRNREKEEDDVEEEEEELRYNNKYRRRGANALTEERSVNRVVPQQQAERQVLNGMVLEGEEEGQEEEEDLDDCYETKVSSTSANPSLQRVQYQYHDSRFV